MNGQQGAQPVRQSPRDYYYAPYSEGHPSQPVSDDTAEVIGGLVAITAASIAPREFRPLAAEVVGSVETFPFPTPSIASFSSAVSKIVGETTNAAYDDFGTWLQNVNTAFAQANDPQSWMSQDYGNPSMDDGDD